MLKDSERRIAGTSVVRFPDSMICLSANPSI
jgi:hypothetical protein